MENLLIQLVCFFEACLDDHSSHTFRYLKLDRHKDGFIVPFPTGTSSDQYIIGQCNIIRRTCYNLLLSVLALPRSLEFYWDSYVCVKHSFSGYDFLTGIVSSLRPSRVTKGQRLWFKEPVFIHGRDVVWFSGLTHASVMSCRAGWSAINRKVAEVTAEVEAPSADLTDINDLSLLLRKR